MRTAKIILLAGALSPVLSLPGEKTNPFLPTEKAFYASEAQLSFIRPGLSIRILSASIANDGTMRMRFRLTDKFGGPVDRLGIETAGPVSLNMVAAVLPAGRTEYLSYITRIQTSHITNRSAVQAIGESNGVFTLEGPGEYTYTFRTRAPQGFDRTATHTFGIYANRNLNDFDLGVNYASATFNFVPDGSPVTRVHDVVRNGACNSCHGEVYYHGGSRRGVEMCVLCHYEPSIDPDTGNSIGLAVMTHKIHAGRQLPSVRAGGKYQLIGRNQQVSDFSRGAFPADIRNCEACHPQSGPHVAAQAGRMFAATRVACGSCHDDIDFATGQGHIPQQDDSRCVLCHRPDSGQEFDASIRGAHTIPEQSRNLKGVAIEILEVANTAAGQRPQVTFRLRTGDGQPLTPQEMTSLNLNLSGPAADYTSYVSESARGATVGSSGTATYTFTAAIPANARGSYSVHAEGYRNTTFPGNGGVPITVRDPLTNVKVYFSVDGSPVERRRDVVSLEKCNACHHELEFHGRNRNTIDACTVCHNPTRTDGARRPAANAPAESINFGLMIHRIHSGRHLARPYTLFGFRGMTNFNHVNYPNDLANCASCHINNSQRLPLSPNLLPQVTDPRGFWTTPGPSSAACLGCHSTRDAAAHARTYTNEVGESCGVCHGPRASFAVDKVHAR